MTYELLKLVTTLLVLTHQTRANSLQDKAGKFLFNIIRFSNDACDAGDSKTGVCMTSSECTSSGGAASGTCAKGYGTCCLLYKSTCDDIVKANNTYIRNPDYSASYEPTSTTNCKFELENPGDICQYRLDFVQFQLENPGVGAAAATGTGACTNDYLTITGANKQVLPVICGDATGQHMYVCAGTTGEKAIMDFKVTNAAMWDIKVTQIKCGDTSLAPSGCLQYYTGEMGTVSSFNFDGSKHLIENHDYTICVRPEAGACGIEWMEDPDETDAFIMSTADWTTVNIAAAGDIPANAATSTYSAGPLVGDHCEESWITIPGAFTTTSEADTLDYYLGAAYADANPENDVKLVGPQDRMCGYRLNNKGMTLAAADGGIIPTGNAAVAPLSPDFSSDNIVSSVKSYTSFLLSVHSRASGDPAPATTNVVQPTGFKLKYKLLSSC